MVLKATPMGSLGVNLEIGLEAGPLSQWLYGALREAGLAVELLETRHVKTALSTMPVKTDRISAAFDGAPSVRTAAVCCSLWRGGSWRSPISWRRRSLIGAFRPEPSTPWQTFGAPAFSPLRVAMKSRRSRLFAFRRGGEDPLFAHLSRFGHR